LRQDNRDRAQRVVYAVLCAFAIVVTACVWAGWSLSDVFRAVLP
jgi:hypothetical protein